MDVSGQSMLPMAAIGAIMMPGTLFKVLAGLLLLIGVAITLLRASARRERLAEIPARREPLAEIPARREPLAATEPLRPARGYRGRRREV